MASTRAPGDGGVAELALEGAQPLRPANDPPQLNDIIRDIVNKAAEASRVIGLMSTVDLSTVRVFLRGNEVTPVRA